MTEPALPCPDLRPRDFSARLSRRAGPIGARRPRRHAGRRLAGLAAAIAVPAVAAPVEWHPAALVAPPAKPLGFEVPGESFPGSAFYYLDDLPNLRNPAGPGSADAAE